MEHKPILGQVAHFSINADDVARAQAFYANVFGWTYEPYGPPGFFMVSFPSAEPAPILGSIQGRRELIPGVKANGFECTIAVADIGETERRILSNGGQIIMQKTTLPAIGHLLFFADPEGNMVGAMQYDSAAT